MIPATTFVGRRVAVFGLGRSGTATYRSLVAGGAIVLAWDDNERSRAEAVAAGLNLDDLDAVDWSRIDSLVLAPGVPLNHPAPHWTAHPGQRSRRRNHWRHRNIRSRACGAGSRGTVHCDYGNQRQIDDHRIGCAHFEVRWPRCADGWQYWSANPCARATGIRSNLCR